MLANTKKQLLSNHSIAVANVALKIFKSLKFAENTLMQKTFENFNSLEEQIFYAGLFHDIGKVDNSFQDWIVSINDKSNKDKDYNDGVHIEVKKKEDKFSFFNYPRHNEISWALASFFLEDKVSYSALYAIYYHHAKVIRNEKNKEIEWGRKTILEKSFNDEVEMKNKVELFFESILKFPNSLCGYKDKIEVMLKNFKDNAYFENGKGLSTPGFLYKDIDIEKYKKNTQVLDNKEINNLLIRSIVISADRVVSSWDNQYLIESVQDNYFPSVFSNVNSNLDTSIEEMLEKFNVSNLNNLINQKRDEEQREIALKLSNSKKIKTLFGPAGCGKTKIFLEWYLNKVKENPKENKKLYIIAPRKMICSSLFNELCSDLYLPKAKIEVLSGEAKLFWDGNRIYNLDEEKVEQEAEITITTIDQVVSIMMSHQKIDMLIDILRSYVVFDEFHEFFNTSGIVMMFKLFIELKKRLENANTLFVSATPNYYFIENYLNIKNSVEYIDTFNKELYKFKFSIYSSETSLNKNALDNSEIFGNLPKGSIVIFNTAIDSQRSSLFAEKMEKTLNFHSKLTPSDKNLIYKKITKEWSKKLPDSEFVLRAGPIVQASLNISTLNLYTQICSAENWCQRVGRANRFASNLAQATVTTILSEQTLNNISANNSEIKFLRKISSEKQTIAWINFFMYKFYSGKEIDTIQKEVSLTLSEIYEAYKEFHQNVEVKKSYEEDFNLILDNSLKIFENNDFTPKEFFKMKVSSKKQEKLSSSSLRGSSVYVLPVRYEYYTKTIGEWLYIPSEDVSNQKMLTLSEQDLNGKNALLNNQISVVTNKQISGLQNSTYEKNYKNMNHQRIKIEGKNKTSPILLSYPTSVYDFEIKNSDGYYYVNKGDLIIGLYQIK